MPHPRARVGVLPPLPRMPDTALYSGSGCAWVLPPTKVNAQEVKQWELEDRFRSA